MQSETPAAILIDPHPLWLDAVTHVVSEVPLAILGRSSSLQGGTDLISRLQPDLAIAEIAAADPTDGLSWIEQVADQLGTKLVILTTRDEREYIHAALARGASAYVLKSAHPDDLVATIRQIFDRSIYFAPRQIKSAPLERSQTYMPVVPLSHDLTRRELEILRLVAEGHSNARLAKMLWVTEQTVKFHLSNIYRKIGVSNRTEAGRWAQLHGLLQQQSADPTQVA